MLFEIVIKIVIYALASWKLFDIIFGTEKPKIALQDEILTEITLITIRLLTQSETRKEPTEADYRKILRNIKREIQNSPLTDNDIKTIENALEELNNR